MNFENSQIFITALITVIVSAGLLGGLFFTLGSKKSHYIWFLIVMLPFSAMVNLLVKAPLNRLVLNISGLNAGVNLEQPLLYLLFLAFLAPVTEELVKIVPILLPDQWKKMKLDPLWFGAWVGLGFGLGEALYIAYGIAKSSQFVGLPWYAFGGYFGERLIVCLIHAILTAIFTWFLYQKKFFTGYGVVVVLHWFVNLGAILLALGVIGPFFVNILLFLAVFLLVFVFEKLRKCWLLTISNETQSEEIVFYQRN